MNAEKKRWGFVTFYLILAIAAIASGGLLGWVIGKVREEANIPEVVLTVLIVSSLIMLLAVLAILVAVLAGLGLTDRRYALGLPEGTVRAVIALSLLLVFVTTGVFLFNQLETAPLSKGLPETQFQALMEKQGERVTFFQARTEAEKTVYDIRLKTEKSEPSRQFANQLLTILGTLVGTVSGFYFGTRALAAARGIAVPALPVIRDMKPREGKAEEQPFEIYGENFDAPREVKLVCEGDEILGTDITWSASKIHCTFNLKGKSAGSEWDLIVVNQDGGKDQFTKMFTVAGPPEPPPVVSPAPTPPTLEKISPDKAPKGKVIVTIEGTGFAKGAEVKLKQAEVEVAEKVKDEDFTVTKITCTFDLTDKPAGKWDVIVTNPDKKEGKKDAWFEVT